MDHKLAILFVVFCAAQLGNSLECYRCEKGTCATSLGDTVKCGNVVTNHVAACLKQTFEDRVTGKLETIRKCIISEKSTNGQINYKCTSNDGTVKECNTCTTDLCNSASMVTYPFYALVASLLVTFTTKLF